jgi:hypothetical protein
MQAERIRKSRVDPHTYYFIGPGMWTDRSVEHVEAAAEQCLMSPKAVVEIFKLTQFSHLYAVPKPEDDISDDEAKDLFAHDASHVEFLLNRMSMLKMRHLAAIWQNCQDWLWFWSARDLEIERRAKWREQWEDGERRAEALIQKAENMGRASQ